MNIDWDKLFEFLLILMDRICPAPPEEAEDDHQHEFCQARVRAAKNPIRRAIAIRRGLAQQGREQGLRGRRLREAVNVAYHSEVVPKLANMTDEEYEAFAMGCSNMAAVDDPQE